MTTPASPSPRTQSSPPPPHRRGLGAPASHGWPWLLRVAAFTGAAGAVLMQLAGRFVGPSLVVYTVLVLGAALVLPRRPRLSAWTLLLVSALDLALHAFMLGILVEGIELGILYVLTVLGLLTTLLTAVSAVQVLRHGWQPTRAPIRLLAVAVVTLVIATAVTTSAYLTRPTVDPGPDEPVLTTTGLRVSDDALVLQADGESASLVLRNDDWLYPRSFDIDALDVHVVVPPRTGRRVELPPGRYEFYDYVTMTDATSGVVTVEK